MQTNSELSQLLKKFFSINKSKPAATNNSLKNGSLYEDSPVQDMKLQYKPEPESNAPKSNRHPTINSDVRLKDIYDLYNITTLNKLNARQKPNLMRKKKLHQKTIIAKIIDPEVVKLINKFLLNIK